jgi:oligoribonuclease
MLLHPDLTKHLLWIDMEMTGLNPQTDMPLEICLATIDTEYNINSFFQSVIYQESNVLQSMDHWNQIHHRKSGLLEDVKTKGRFMMDVEKDMIAFLEHNFAKQHLVKDIYLVGNSIHQDRRFLENYFMEFTRHIHFRILDVSSLKIIANLHSQTKFPKKIGTKSNHRAAEDVEFSIQEFKFYMTEFWKPNPK